MNIDNFNLLGFLSKKINYCRRNISLFMNRSGKKLFFMVITGILGSSFTLAILFLSFSISTNLNLDSLIDDSCPFLNRPYFQIVMLLSALFVLPLEDLFLVHHKRFIPFGGHLLFFDLPRFPTDNYDRFNVFKSSLIVSDDLSFS